MEIFKLFGSIFVDNERANRSIDQTDNKAKGLSGTFKKGISQVGKWGKAVGAAAGAVAIAFTGKAVKAAADFQKQMANVSTLLDGDVKKRIGELGENVKKLAVDTGTSTELLTDGLYQVVSAFGDTADSMKILETASKGATAGNATVTDSVNLLSAVTKGYGDTSAEAAQKASDLAFLTVKLGQTSFPELASSMGKVIPLASTMKVKQEELFGAMATLTGVTGNTAEVSTQLRATIQGLLQPTKEMQAALEQLGFSNGQAAIESEGLQGTLDLLKRTVGGNEIAFSQLFSSVESKNAVLALTGAQADNFKEKLAAMGEAAGATDAAFKKQSQTVEGMMKRIGQLGNTLTISFGEMVLPIVQKFLEWVVNSMPMIQKGFTTTFNVINEVVQKVTEWLIKMYESNKETFDSLLETFKNVFETIGEIIKTTLETSYELIKTIILAISALWEEFGDEFMLIVKYMLDNVVPLFENSFEVLNNILKFFIDLFSGNWGALWEDVKNILTSAISLIRNTLQYAIDSWKNIIRTGLNFISGIFTNIFNGIKNTVENILNGMINGVKNGINAMIGFLNKGINGINDLLTFELPDIMGGGQIGVSIPNIPMLANGGTITKAGRVLVGEAGPELLDLPRGAKVTPLSGPNAPGGMTINIYGDIDSDDRVKELGKEFYYQNQRVLRAEGVR